MRNVIILLLLILIIVDSKPIEKNYGTDDQMNIKLEDGLDTEDKSKDIIKAKDFIDESDKPSVDEKSGDKRSAEISDGSGEENSSGNEVSDSKEDVKIVATSKVEVGEKRDEFERGLIDDSPPSTEKVEKRSHKPSHKDKHKSEHSNKNEKNHDVKPDSKKRNATIGAGGWWNCGCCDNGGHQVEHQKEQHHECAQHHQQECENCHGHHEKAHDHEHHDKHAEKEHGYEMYEEWGEHQGKAQGHAGHHECCEQAHQAHECEKVLDCGHKCCHHEEQHTQPCCHPNCCQVDIGNNCNCPCCGGGIGK